jgi:hypothetical protein
LCRRRKERESIGREGESKGKKEVSSGYKSNKICTGSVKTNLQIKVTTNNHERTGSTKLQEKKKQDSRE